MTFELRRPVEPTYPITHRDGRYSPLPMALCLTEREQRERLSWWRRTEDLRHDCVRIRALVALCALALALLCGGWLLCAPRLKAPEAKMPARDASGHKVVWLPTTTEAR